MDLILFAAAALISWLAGAYFWSAIGLAFTLYIFIRLLRGMGQRIPIIELMTTLAALQWILGPFIEYHDAYQHYKYFMYVDEHRYMAYVVPALLAFWGGTRLFRSRISLDEVNREVRQVIDSYPWFPYLLVGVGALIPYLSPLFPAGLGFFFFLLGNVKYIGALYLLQSKSPYRWPVFWGIILFTALASIGIGMFHDLLLWGMLIFTFVAREWKLKMPGKATFAVLGILMAVTIQGVKFEYRYITWNGDYQGSRAGLFLRLAADEWRTGEIFMPSYDIDMNVRLNQGWIISAVMNNVPRFEPYARGVTIGEGLRNSLVPRILDPGKQEAGGRDLFRVYTGLYINDYTSMGISLAGEGYANFGYLGGILFLFAWGLFIGWFWRWLERMNRFFPTLLLWSPLLFLQVVKAETEFGVVLNHLVKSTLVVFTIVLLLRWTLGIEGGRDGETERHRD